MKCIGCGREIPDDSVFCTYCGTDQSAAQQPQQPVQQPQQPVQQTQQTVYQEQYTQQPQYQQPTQQQPAPQQPAPQQPAPQGDGGKKGLLIAGICIGVALLIVGIVIVILLLKKDDDGDDKKAEKTTEATTEETTEEITTEAVTEATPDEPAPTPYAEEHGITFSGLGDKASGNTNNYFYYKDEFDAGEGEGFYETDGIASESATYSSYVNDVVVSDPDSEGNVIYTVEVIADDTAVVVDNSDRSWVVVTQTWRPRAFDYYTGSFIDNGQTDSGIGDKTEFENTNLVFDDKETNVKSVYSYEWINRDQTEESVENGEKTSFVDDTKYVYSFKVPQDYDGVVIALYNGDVDRDEYDKATELDDKPRYKDNNGNPIKFFDEDAIGYTKNADNAVFVRLSDVARKSTPDAISSIYSVIDYPDLSDFSWTDDVKGGDYSQGNETITDAAAVNGWWQGYILWDPDNKMDSYGEELCNVQLTSSGSSMDWKWDYYEVRWGDSEEWETKDEETTMTGTFNSDGTLTFDAESIGMAFEVYGFYTDGYHQYAVGWMTAQSGEQAWVFLYRP